MTRFVVWEGEEGHRTIRDILEVEPLTPAGRMTAQVRAFVENALYYGRKLEFERRES